MKKIIFILMVFVLIIFSSGCKIKDMEYKINETLAAEEEKGPETIEKPEEEPKKEAEERKAECTEDICEGDILQRCVLGTKVALTCHYGCQDGKCGVPIEPVNKQGVFRVKNLQLNESIGEEVRILTQANLAALQGGVITTKTKATPYSQFLKFDSDGISSGKPVFKKDGGETRDYLFFDDKDIFEYEIEFAAGLQSKIDNGRLVDLEDETINILGRPYAVIMAKIDSNNGVELDLISGEIHDILGEGETKVYKIGGTTYNIRASIVSDAAQSVKLTVNEKSTSELKEGEVDVLSDGSEVGIREIITTEAGENGRDLIEMYVGASKINFKDSNTADNEFERSVKLRQKTIEGGKVRIKGSRSGDIYTLNTITYRFEAGDEYYLKDGEKLSDYIGSAMLGGWDIMYEGLEDVPTSIIKLDSSGDDAYKLQFESTSGKEYDIPLLDNSVTFKYGDEDQDLIYIEGASNTDFVIEENDFFAASSSNTDDGRTNIMKYDGIDTGSSTILFDDESGSTITAAYLPSSTAGVLGEGSFSISGDSFNFFISDASGNPIAVDLTGDNSFGDEANIVTRGGGILDLGSSLTPASPLTITLTTLKKNIRERSSDESVSIVFTSNAVLDVDIPSQSAIKLGKADSSTDMGLTEYGALFIKEDAGNNNDLIIEYPHKQRQPVVNILG